MKLSSHLFLLTLLIALPLVTDLRADEASEPEGKDLGEKPGQGSPAGDEAKGDVSPAVVAFAEAKRYFMDGQFGKAAMKFREANVLKPSWKLFYNIGQCETAAKHYGLALEAFEQYLARGGDGVARQNDFGSRGDSGVFPTPGVFTSIHG